MPRYNQYRDEVSLAQPDPGRSNRHVAPSSNRHSSNPNNHNRQRRRRRYSNFTLISSWVKYSMFFFNFFFWIFGALCVAIGLYAMIDKWNSGESFKLDNVFDVIFNLAFLLVIVGGVVFVVSFAGCIGALRENMCLLQFYSFCLLLFFLLEMALAGMGFIFPHKISTFVEETLSEELIMSYRDDLDFQNMIDLVQSEFHCCGISKEQSYRDWSKNEYFNCTVDPAANPSVERCGVPYSCCLPQVSSDGNPELVNLMCGFGVQEEPFEKVVKKIYTQGCLDRIQGIVEQNLFVVAGIALGIAAAQLLVIWLARTLENQIENQRSLWG